MTYEYLKNLKENAVTLKLLNSDNFAFSLSFFHFVFIENRKLSLSHGEILSYLDDYIFDIKQTYPDILPKAAKDYLEDFSSDKNAFLSKRHGSDDEAIYELTPYTHKALEFIEGLEKKEFVGSRSKFNIIFELLEELEFETSLSDEERIKKLQESKREIDQRIARIEMKKDLRFDSARIKEHFMQIEEMARKLKYDFSEIEYNFRNLNAMAMENIIQSHEAKSEVLGTIFEREDEIKNSDQGKSFLAFWRLLTDVEMSDKLGSLVDNLYKIKTIKDFDQDRKLKNLKYTLLQSGEKIAKVSSKLIEQLRRFLDDRAWIENRRILDLCKGIQKNAIEIKENLPRSRNFAQLDAVGVSIGSVFSRELFRVKTAQVFSDEVLDEVIELDMESFYQQFFIDEALLHRNIASVLKSKTQCSLSDIVKRFEIKQGIAELVGYISIAKHSSSAVIDEFSLVHFKISDNSGEIKEIKMPKIIFMRE